MLSAVTAVIPAEAAGSVQLSQAAYSVAEAGSAVTITATRTDSGGAASVKYATSAGTASAGADYATTSGTLTWASGDVADKTFTVPIVPDELDEADTETFKVTLSSATGTSLGSPNSATVSIVDDDLPPTVQFSQAASSGAESTASAVIGVVLSAPSARTVTVKYATANGAGSDGAVSGSDYTAKSGTLSFSPGQTSKTISVPILNNTAVEQDETFTVTLSTPVNATTDGAITVHTYTINNDDPAGAIRLGSATYSVSEAGPAAKITVKRVGGKAGPVSVTYGTSDGTAAAGVEYTATDQQLNWGDGVTADQTFTVRVADDALDEPNKTFSVTLSAPTGGAILGSPDTATVTIADDDPTPTVQFALSSSRAPESTTPLTIAVALSAPSSQTITVNYATANGTAVAGGASPDYTAASGTLTFAPGQTSKSVTVEIADDQTKEANETFSVKLSAPVNAKLGSRTTHACTIANDDPAGLIQLGALEYAVGEAGPTATLTATRHGGSFGIVSAKYATSAGTATAGVDYATASGTLTWGDGDTADKVLTVAVAPDELDEPDKTFKVTLSSPTNGAVLGPRSSGTVTITDDDPTPTVQFDQAASAGPETASPAVIAVTLSAPSGRSVTVKYATENLSATSGSDYTAASGTLTFTPGQTSKTVSVPILNNTAVESDETFKVTLSNPVNAELRAVPEEHVRTIVDEDRFGAFKLSATSYSASEPGATATAATITVVRVGGSAEAVGVTCATSDGTATSSSDYTATSKTLTFAAGETSKTFTVPIGDDLLDEAGETFTVTLSDPTGGAILAAPTSATVTIADNDPTPTVQFDTAASSGAESRSPAAIGVVLSAASGQEVSVKYATANGTATISGNDYAAASGTLTFPPGETRRAIDVPVLDDTSVEPNETFSVTLSSPVKATLGTRTKHVYTIENDDPAGSVRLGAAAYSVDEAGGTVTITVARAGGSSGAVGVSFATSAGTATAADFTPVSGTRSGGVGDTADKTITVPISGDALDEADEETFSVTLSAPTGGATLGAPSSATVTIVDDDPVPTVRFEQGASSGAESTTPAGIDVILSAASGLEVRVDYETANGAPPTGALAGSDYTATSGTLTFAPGQTRKTIGVPILDNTTGESDEAFTVRLGAPVNASLVAPTVHTYTINDEDNFGAIKLSLPAYPVGEAGGAITITAIRTGGGNGAVGATWVTTDGTAAAGADYAAATGTVSWADGDTANKTFTVTIAGDSVVEMNETFSVTLSAPTGGAVLGAPSTATVTIEDDDAPTVQFSQAASSGLETATPAAIEVTLSAASGRTVTVNFATADGSAAAGADYTATSGTLTFTPGETSKTIAVPILADVVPDPDETFTVALSGPTNATPGATTVHTYTIADVLPPNSPPELTPIGNKTVAETALLEFTVQATDLNGDTLTFSSSALPSGASFDPPSRVFSWRPTYVQAGSYPITISVTDGEDSDSETFTVTVTQTNPTLSCEGCHNGSPYDPDGAGPAPAAPNVMGNGTNPAGIGTNKKPYDDGTYGYNVNGHGRDNDTFAISRGNAINVACTACHDINQPPGAHLDGVLNGRLSPDTRNANSFHLNSSLVSASGPTSEWDAQVRFDNTCYNLCHKGKFIADMRHGGVSTTPPAPNAKMFGALNSSTGDRVSKSAPSNTPPPVIFYDMHLRDLGSYNGIPHFMLCVSCHDPHGTPVVTSPVGNNRMILYFWESPGTLCAKCH
jgi:hypothetical protein